MKILLVFLLILSAGCQSKIETLNPPLNGFYHKQLNCDGILIRSHKDVNDEALYEMARRIRRVTKHLPNVVENLAAEKAPIHIIGRNQIITDTPMYAYMKGKKNNKGEDFAKRSSALCCFTAFCTERGLLLLPKYRFFDKRDVPTHEFNHLIMNYGIPDELMHKIEDHYEATLKKGLWKGAYAASTADEFFAETSMWYWGTNGDTLKMVDKDKMLKKGPESLRKYDPDTYKFLDDFFKGKMEVKLFKRAELKSDPEAKSTDYKSRRNHILFDNQSDKSVKLFWLDYQNKLRTMGEVSGMSKHGRGTYRGHVWVVQDDKGKEIGRYKMSLNSAKVIIK